MIKNCLGCHKPLTKVKRANEIILVCKHKGCEDCGEIFGSYRVGVAKEPARKYLCGVCDRAIVGAKAFAPNGVYHPSCVSKILIDNRKINGKR